MFLCQANVTTYWNAYMNFNPSFETTLVRLLVHMANAYDGY